MRIAFISYEYPPDTGKSGIGTYTRQVCMMLANMGCDVHVFAGSHQREGRSMEEGLYVHRIICSDPHDFNKRVLPVFAKEQTLRSFDLIESPEIHANAWEIKKAYPGLPMVVRLHAPNWLVEQLKKTYIPFFAKLRYVMGALRRGRIDAGYWRAYDVASDPDRAFTLFADAVSAPSATMKNWAVKKWKIPAADIYVISNPFTPPADLLQLPIHLKAVNKEIVFFGRLNVLKGLVNATHTMKRILMEFQGYRFKVIGDDGPGPQHGINMRAWMQQELKAVMGRVKFIDGVAYEELPAALADAEIILLPALFESFSYTCAEAMAAGKAVVGSRDTGMADMIEHNKTGLLVDAQNEAEIYKALKQLVGDNEARYRMAINARQSIQSKYNAQKLAEDYLHFYKNVVITD